MPQHIGIVACSVEGAALCYRTICVEGAQLLGAHGHPEVSMHTHPLADYVNRIDRGDWAGVLRGRRVLLTSLALMRGLAGDAMWAVRLSAALAGRHGPAARCQSSALG